MREAAWARWTGPEHLPRAIGGVLEVQWADSVHFSLLSCLLWSCLERLLEVPAGWAALLRWWKAECVGGEEWYCQASWLCQVQGPTAVPAP